VPGIHQELQSLYNVPTAGFYAAWFIEGAHDLGEAIPRKPSRLL
jgi:hypothetical protein